MAENKKLFLDLKMGNNMMQKVTRMETSEVNPSGYCYSVSACFRLTFSLLTLPSLKLINFLKLQTVTQLGLLNSFPMNGHTLGFCTWSQNIENFVSPKLSLWESKG